MFNLAYSSNTSSFINGAYEVAQFDVSSFVNLAYSSSGPEITVLSDITKEENKFICTLDGIEIAMEQFYIFRRQGFLTTIVIDLAEDIWDFVKTKLGKEIIINWQSESLTGEMANSLLQDVSFTKDHRGRKVKLHSFRSKKEVSTSKFILSDIAERTVINGGITSVKCNVQPTIGPEDIVTLDGVDYTVSSIKITANRIKTITVINFG